MDTRRSQKSRLGRLLRLALSALGLLLFGLMVLLIFVWHVPQSPAALRTFVQKQLEAATGTIVRFDGPAPRLIVPDRRLEIRNVSFYSDEASSVPAFRLGRIDVKVSPGALLSGDRSPAERITIGEPTRIEYYYAPEGLRPGESARFLAQTLQRLSRNSHSSAGDLRINDIEVAFIEDGARNEPAGGSAPDAAVAVLRGALTAGASSGSGTAAAFEGLIDAGGLHSTLKGTLAAAGASSRTLSLEFGKVHIPLPLDGKTAVFSAEAGTKLQLGVRQEGAVYSVTGSTSIPALELEAPQAKGLHLFDRNLSMHWDADYDTSSAALLIRDAAFSSDLAKAQIRGHASAEAPHPFDLETTATRLGGAYRDVLESFLPDGYRLEAPDESFRLALALTGDRTRVENLDGSLSFTSVTLASPALPSPLKRLRGEIRFRPDRIEMRSLSGTTGRTRVQLGGELSGDYLRGEEALLSLNWKAAASAGDLAAILAAADASTEDDGTAAGSITGSGTLKQRISLRAPGSDLAPPDVKGTIQFAEVSFSHPALPVPVEGLNGMLKVEGDRVRVERLSGQINGTPAEVNGVVTGNRYFWRDPALSATVTTRLNLASLPDSLPEEIRESAARNRIGGEADARLQIAGSLREPGQTRVTGSMTLRKATADIALKDSLLEIRSGEASLSWNGSSLILDRLQARLNGEPFTASGLLSQEQISLKARGTIELGAIPRTFPQAANWFELAGPATIDLRLNQGGPNGQASGTDSTPAGAAPVVPNHYTDQEGVRGAALGALTNLLRTSGARLVRAVNSGSESGVEGSITLGNGKSGVRIRHHAMPGGQRRNEAGRPIPQGELRNVRGRLVLQGNRLSTSKGSPLTCDLADTKNCTVAGTIELRPGSFPKMTITASARGEAVFDTWLTGWGKEIPTLPSPPDTGRAFDLDFTFSAPRAIYKGQAAGRTRLELNYSLLHRPDSPRRTVFKRLEVDGIQGGRTVASGELLSYVWKPSQYPRWNAQARFQQMGMLPLLTWIFADVRNIDGFATGELTVEGVKTDPLTIRGRGNTVMTNLIIDRTPLIQGLSRQTGRQFQGRRFSSVNTTDFTIADGAMSSRNLNLDSAGGLLLEMRGRYFFADSPRYQARARTIDALMRLKIFQSMLQQLPIVSGIPLVGQLAGGVTQLADEVAGAFLLAFEISGPVEQPVISPVALPVFQGAE